MLQSHPDVDELVLINDRGEVPRCDFYLRLLSSPGMLGTSADTIPREIPYLRADPELTEHWRQELAGIEGLRIGIVWQGSRSFLGDRLRSIPLGQFAPLAGVPGVRLVSLQKGFGSEQIAQIDFPVVDLADRLDEATGAFVDTAAVIRNLDLVVTPDTAIGHLAGALGARSGWPCPSRPTGVGSTAARTLPGIPRCGYFASENLANGPKFFSAWPRPFATEILRQPREIRADDRRPNFPATTRSRRSVRPGTARTWRGTADRGGGRVSQDSGPAPDLVEVHNNLGILLCQQGVLDEAVQQFEQAVALKPDSADAHCNLANVLRQQGKLDQAAARMGRAIGLFPDDAGARNSLGNILHLQKKLNEAAAQFEKAIALRPDFAAAYNNLGNVLLELGKTDWAIRRFEQAIALKPDYAEAFYNLGIAHWHQDQLERAVTRFKQAIGLQPDYADALNNLGSTLREQNKLVEARQVFERLELLHPGSPQSQFGLGTLYLLAEDYRRGWPGWRGGTDYPVPRRCPSCPAGKGNHSPDARCCCSASVDTATRCNSSAMPNGSRHRRAESCWPRSRLWPHCWGRKAIGTSCTCSVRTRSCRFAISIFR